MSNDRVYEVVLTRDYGTPEVTRMKMSAETAVPFAEMFLAGSPAPLRRAEVWVTTYGEKPSTACLFNETRNEYESSPAEEPSDLADVY